MPKRRRPTREEGAVYDEDLDKGEGYFTENGEELPAEVALQAPRVSEEEAQRSQEQLQTQAPDEEGGELRTYLGPGYVGGTAANAELERRIAYCVTERGGQLRKNTTGPTYGVAKDAGGTALVADGSSLATVSTYARVVDPSIP